MRWADCAEGLLKQMREVDGTGNFATSSGVEDSAEDSFQSPQRVRAGCVDSGTNVAGMGLF
jgi:hypothetical protein